MRTYLIVTVLLLVSWIGAFGIAFGVSEWRADREPSQMEIQDAALAILEIEALQQQAQAEACRSAVLWFNALKDGRGEPAFTAFKGMVLVCAELSGSDEP